MQFFNIFEITHSIPRGPSTSKIFFPYLIRLINYCSYDSGDFIRSSKIIRKLLSELGILLENRSKQKNFFYENVAFECVIFESVKIERGKVDRLRQLNHSKSPFFHVYNVLSTQFISNLRFLPSGCIIINASFWLKIFF